MRILIVVISFFICLVSLAADLPDYNPQLAKKLVETEDALLLDVRSEREYKAGSISNAKHIPHFQIKERVDEILKYQKGAKDKPIVVFCAVGGRASKAKSTLISLGFSKVTNLGGLKDWPAKERK